MKHWIGITGQMTARLKYFFHAHHSKDRGVHSPFMFDFIASVLRDKTGYNDYEIAENYRKSLLKNKSRITVTDFGAGSQINSSRLRSLAEIARHAGVDCKSGRLLYRIARHYKPERIVELGTSLGISTHYLALGSPGAQVISVEADPVLASLAGKGLNNDRIINVTLFNDVFDNALPVLLPESPGKTLIFVDGNHNLSSTLKYADFFLSKLPDGSIIVLDDINWSEGMRNAWKEIRGKNALTVDLFRMGIVFVRHDFFKENYTLWF
jgi:predicted O-methyltransferase YrrM